MAHQDVAGPGAATDLVIAYVGGKPIHVSELLSQWLYADSLQVLDQLDHLALQRLVLLEARRLQVEVEPGRAAEAYEKAVAAIEKEIERKRPGMKLDRFVDRVLGLDNIRYRERLRDDALRSLLGERVARMWLLQNEHAFTHVIVVQSEDALKEAQKELADGADFEEVARKHSADPSAKLGGRVAPIVKGDTPMGRLAFETEVGKISAPVYDQGAWLLLRVDDRPVPLVGTWATCAKIVEASLAKSPIDQLELAQWKSSMAKRYEIDRRPFLKLVGQDR